MKMDFFLQKHIPTQRFMGRWFYGNVPRKREEMTREKEPKRLQNWTHTPAWSYRKL